jgi:hypothetical protein
MLVVSIGAIFCLASLKWEIRRYSVLKSGSELKPIHNSTTSTSLSSQHIMTSQLLEREEQHGTWIGDSWIPPDGWKLFSAMEMRSFYQDRSIYWMGDSTARRTTGTMYGILEAANSSSNVPVVGVNHWGVIDLLKGTGLTHELPYRRPMPGGESRNGLFLLQWLVCLKYIEKVLEDELSGKTNLTKNIDTIIISLGIWEAVNSDECQDPSRSTTTIQNNVIDLLGNLQSEKRTVIWRTSGYHQYEKHHFVSDMNGKAMDKIDEIILDQEQKKGTTCNLTYVDWGGAVSPRSIGKERIEGNMAVHYGLEPRHVLIQMITNHLASRRVAT